MNNVIKMKKENGIWEQESSIEQIKQIYGKGLTIGEFETFMQIGKATGLNPFLREIWAVKYGTGPASIFIGRDGYRKSAQENADYEYHLVDAVYSNDKFESNISGVNHTYSLSDRGNLMGAYCLVKRRNAEKPMYTFVELKEYFGKGPVWASKPATMIKKVAEAQGLRMAFQGLFAGTYHEYEDWNTVVEPVEKVAPAKGVLGLKNRLGLVETSIDDVLDKMRQAETLDQLKKAALFAKDLPENDKAMLREIYCKKQQDFKHKRSNNVEI